MMSDELTPLQRGAFEAKEGLCRSIGDHGCGGCPLDELRREKNVACDKACLYYPMLVVEAVTKRKNGTEQPEAASPRKTESIQNDWEADAKRLEKENEELWAKLNAERQRSAQLEKDLREARDSINQKEKLLERVKGQRDAYREPLEWILHDQHGGNADLIKR